MAIPARQPVLYVVGCAAYPSGDLPRFATFAQGEGWDVCVIATPHGAAFMDTAGLAELTRHPVRSQYKQPDEPDVLPPADAFVVAPATFNTISKWAHGISDTLALGLLNEGLGAGLPIIAAPWANARLMRHPAFQRAITDLREWGVRFVFDPDRPAVPGGADAFPWDKVRTAVASLRGSGDEAQR